LYVSTRRVIFSVNGLATEHARLSMLAVGDSDGEVCSVGGAFGEQPCHSARKDVRRRKIRHFWGRSLWRHGNEADRGKLVGDLISPKLELELAGIPRTSSSGPSAYGAF
jgi:hypothetical protein